MTRATTAKVRAAVFASLALLAIACNAITGLDQDFLEVDCVGAACSDASSTDATSDTTTDASSGHDAAQDAPADAALDALVVDGGADGNGDSAAPCVAPTNLGDAAIAPPYSVVGLDLRGYADAGILTFDEATRRNCAGVDQGDPFGDGSEAIAWGNPTSSWLVYDQASKRVRMVMLLPPYAGTLSFTSADKSHSYVVSLGAQIQKDGAPLTIDWSKQSAVDATTDELYRALVATFAPTIKVPPKTTLCTTNPLECANNKHQGNIGSILFRELGLALWTVDAATQPNGSTINRVDLYPPPQYGDIYDSSNWLAFDTTHVDPKAKAFKGAATDNRYIYLAPGSGGTVARYDTTLSFTDPSPDAGAWSTFDTAHLGDGGAIDFEGAASTGDGAYVYFAPSANGMATRYSTASSAFEIDTSWETFDTTTLPGAPQKFAGVVTTGAQGVAVFVPAQSGVVAAHHWSYALGNASNGWSTFDATTLDAKAKGFRGGITVGNKVYLVPHGDGANHYGVALAWDSTSSSLSTGWTKFDFASIDASAVGYYAAVTDWTFVYFIPHDNANGPHGKVMRYDTRLPFDQAGSWSLMDLAQSFSVLGFDSGGFDGRYVYLASYSGSQIVRYDTTRSFGDSLAWSPVQPTDFDSHAQAFHGVVSGPRYLYFVPDTLSTLMRFDAKYPPVGPLASTF